MIEIRGFQPEPGAFCFNIPLGCPLICAVPQQFSLPRSWEVGSQGWLGARVTGQRLFTKERESGPSSLPASSAESQNGGELQAALTQHFTAQVKDPSPVRGYLIKELSCPKTRKYCIVHPPLREVPGNFSLEKIIMLLHL